MPSLDHLWPRPQQCEPREGSAAIGAHPLVSCTKPAGSAARMVLDELRACGVRPRTSGPGAAAIRLTIGGEAPAMAESYRLRIGGSGATVQARDPAGLLYGAATLAQWIRLEARQQSGPPTHLSGVEISDWPSFPARGLMLDVSRDKVPSLTTLTAIIDQLAALKMNQLQLYVEHTFAYRGHDIVWKDASPLTADDIRTLDAYCRARHIELVPNQQSFGHMHRWLVHERYRHLAEVPAGLAHPFSDRVEPFSLCPLDAGSLELLEDLYAQLDDAGFSSSMLNVGCDETFDLGRGRSAAACAERGRGRVYVEFLGAVHDRLRARGRWPGGRPTRSTTWRRPRSAATTTARPAT